MTKLIPLALLASTLLVAGCSDADATGKEPAAPSKVTSPDPATLDKTAPRAETTEMPKTAADKAVDTAATTPAGIAGSLSKLLSGITDGDTAKAAKSQLETLTGQLGGAMANLKSAGNSGGNDATSMLGDLAKKAAAAISPELAKSFEGISTQIASLMQKPEVQSAIGPILEKLKGLVSM